MHKKIWLAFFIFLLLLFSGCAKKKEDAPDLNIPFLPSQEKNNDQNQPQVNADQNNPVELTDQNKPGKEEKKEPETYDPALLKSIEDCLLKETQLQVDLCLIEVAKSKKNDLPCERISRELSDRCFYSAGVEMQKHLICEKIKDQVFRDNCYKDIGKALKDNDVCKKVFDLQKRDECYSSSISFQNCKLIFDQSKRDSCFSDLAKSLNDPNVCNNVSQRFERFEGEEKGQYFRDRCLNNFSDLNGENCFLWTDSTKRANCFYNADDISTKNIDCSKAQDENSILGCELWIASSHGDTAKCYDFPYSVSLTCIDRIVNKYYEAGACDRIRQYQKRNSCYYNLAIDKNDFLFCQRIDGNNMLKNNCYGEIAFMHKNEDICFNMDKISTELIENCIKKIALETNDTSKCERIQRDVAYINCYVGLAVKNSLHELCEKTTRETMRTLDYSSKEQCYKSYAVATKDYSMCKKISRLFLQNQCNEEVNIAITCIDGDGKCDPKVCTYLGDSLGKNNYDNDCTEEQVKAERTK
ncbi:MAG: hypothetical protein QXD98_00945 [Candidatus Diapherotrites archaeon]